MTATTARIVPFVARPVALRVCSSCETVFRAARGWHTECRACYHGARAVRSIAEAARRLREAAR